MDDVDYLVEDNAMDDFAYHREWMGPMVGPLLKMILNNNYREGSPWELAQWRCKLGTKGRCWECSNHHICLRFRSGWCQDIPDLSSLERKMKDCNTNRRDGVARLSGDELR